MDTSRESEESDAQIISRSVVDPNAFSDLYDRHAEALLRFFVRRTGCGQTAADLTAETFAQAFASRHRFRDVGAPGRAWLWTIADRQLSRYIRREQVATRARARLGVAPIQLDDDDLERVERMADLPRLREHLTGALATLPAQQADAVQLRVVEGLPYPEVARRLVCTEGAARVRVSRALVRLAATIEEQT
jgi:RNA polymerase sigma factor (sigma-70 family)